MTSDQHVARAYRRYDVAKLALLIVTVLLLMVALAVLTAVALQNRDNGRAIRDCTDPAGECFQRSAQRQAEVIGEPRAPINNVAIIAAACGAANPGDIPATRECVEEGLADR